MPLTFNAELATCGRKAVTVDKLFVEPRDGTGRSAITFGNMEDHPEVDPKAPFTDLTTGEGNRDASKARPEHVDEAEDMWGDDESEPGSDPEHARRLAAIRTELLKRSRQSSTPNE